MASVLLLHGLHPEEMETRVLRALDKVRPFLHSNGGDVELVSIADGVVKLRVQKEGGGCASTAATMKSAVEDAVTEVAPDAAQIMAEVVQQPSFVKAGGNYLNTGSKGEPLSRANIRRRIVRRTHREFIRERNGALLSESRAAKARAGPRETLQGLARTSAGRLTRGCRIFRPRKIDARKETE